MEIEYIIFTLFGIVLCAVVTGVFILLFCMKSFKSSGRYYDTEDDENKNIIMKEQNIFNLQGSKKLIEIPFQV